MSRRAWVGYLALWIAMMALRQDVWFRDNPRLVLGFMPIGLAYQALYSVLAACVMAALVHWAWPRDLEALESSDTQDRRP